MPQGNRNRVTAIETQCIKSCSCGREFLNLKSELKSLKTKQKIMFAVTQRRNQREDRRKRNTDLLVQTLTALIISKHVFQEMPSCPRCHPAVIFPDPLDLLETRTYVIRLNR